MSFDGAAFGKEIVAEVKRYIDMTNTPLFGRIEQLEKQLIEATETIAEMSSSISQTVTLNLDTKLFSAVMEGLASEAKKLEDSVPNLVANAVNSAVAALPPPVDGKSVTVEDVRPLLDVELETFKLELGKTFDAELDRIQNSVKDGKDGTSVTLEQVLGELQPLFDTALSKASDSFARLEVNTSETIKQMSSRVEEAIAAIPVPQDGKSVTLEDVRPILDEALADLNKERVHIGEHVTHLSKQLTEQVDAAIAAIPVPKDGISVTLEDVQPVLDEAIGQLRAKYTEIDGFVSNISHQINENLNTAISNIPVPKDGVSVTIDEVLPKLEDGIKAYMTTLTKSLDEALNDVRTLGTEGLAAVNEAIASIPAPIPGEPGKSVTLDDVRPMITEFFKEQAEHIGNLIASHNDGFQQVTASFSQTIELATSAVSEALEALPAQIRKEAEDVVLGFPIPKDGEPGKDAEPLDLDWVQGVVADKVNEAVKALPVPADGKDGAHGRSIVKVKLDDEGLMHLEYSDLTSDAIELIGEGEFDIIARKAASLIPVPKDGKDGINLAGAFINRDGELVVTLSNGETKELGPVLPKDGKDGKDGLDGVNFDDLDIEFNEEARTLTFKAARGENVKQWDFKLHYPIDMGVYKEDSDYLRGDGVTFGGSFWFAQKDAPIGKPGQSDDWRLAVKRGRDGKSVKEIGPQSNIPLDRS